MVSPINGWEANETFHYGDIPTCKGITSPQQGRKVNTFTKLSLPNDQEASEMSYYSYVVRPLLAMVQCFQQGRESLHFLKGKPYEVVWNPTQHLIIQAW